MATVDSPYTSYSDTAAQKRVITDVISIIDPSDAPAIEYLGGLDGAASKFNFQNWPGTAPQWLEDTLPALTDTLGATVAANATSITVADGTLWHVGDIFNVGTTPTTYWVSAVNTSTNVLTVTTIGGTDATHATTDGVEIIGMARLEGADSDASGMTSKSVGTNYTQIWHEEVKVSRTANSIQQYGEGQAFDYEAAKKVPGLMRMIDKHVLHNSVRSAGSATTPRIMGGIQTFISTNKISGASLTKAKFETAMQSIYESGGSSRVAAIVNPTNLGKIAGFYENSAYLRVTQDVTNVGMPRVKTIETQFGTVDLVLDRWAKTATIPIVDPQHCGMLTFYPFTQEPLPSSGDYVKGQVVGEFTFCLRQEKAHALLTAVS